jgi:hypothetical protein
MPDHVKPESTPETLEETITMTLTDLRAFKDRLLVADCICEIAIESVSHGIAVQDAIAGMMDFSRDSLDFCITDLEDVLKASRKEATS